MDIIAAHRQGLLEKLDQECSDLVGRPRDFGQRAVVLHHLYDHGLGAHVWALVEARRQLDIDAALRRLSERRATWWRSKGSREVAAERLAALAEAIGEEAQRRTHAAYRAYRIAGAPALKDMLDGEVSAECRHWLGELHHRRRIGTTFDTGERSAMAVAVEQAVGDDPDGLVAAAWGGLRDSHLYRPASRLLSTVGLDRAITAGERKGWDREERDFRANPLLPERFRANPTQHFYSLLNGLAERRQKEWVEEGSVSVRQALVA